MPIPLNTNQSRPSAKLPTLGSGIELCVIGLRQVPWLEYGTGAQKVGNNGKPRKQLVVTGIVVSHQGSLTGPQGQERPVSIGETVDYYAHGQGWGQWIEGEKAFRTAGYESQVGDIVLIHYVRDEPSAQPGANDKKVRTCTFRRPRPDEQHWLAQAEAAYYALGFDRVDPAGGAPDVDEPFPQTQPYGQTQPYAPQPQPQMAPQPSYAPQPTYQQQPQPTQGYAPQPQQQYPPQQPSPYAPQQTGPGF
jgi:hypothetical protein